jgi:hypothetical protein
VNCVCVCVCVYCVYSILDVGDACGAAEATVKDAYKRLAPRLEQMLATVTPDGVAP